MGKVEPEGVVAGEAVGAAAAEDEVGGGEVLGDGGGPAEEDVGDDAKFGFLGEGVSEEGFEGGDEGG